MTYLGTCQTLEIPKQCGQTELVIKSDQANSIIEAKAARKDYSVDGSGTVVAVFDTGLRNTHFDFKNKVVGQLNLTADNNKYKFDASDGHGHGTNVSGIILANKIHLGVAPEAHIFPVKVMSNVGIGGFKEINKGLRYIIDNNDKIRVSCVLMSLGDRKNHSNSLNFLDHPVTDSIQILQSQNIPCVVTSGNDFFRFKSEQGLTFPGIIQETICVGSTYDSDFGEVIYSSGAKAKSTGVDIITPYSQRLHQSSGGSHHIDLFAPGGPITSSGITDDASSSTQDGTSQAAPFVAGQILLLQHLFRRETKSNKLPSIPLLKKLLIESADTIYDGDNEKDNVKNTKCHYKRLNSRKSLGLALEMIKDLTYLDY